MRQDFDRSASSTVVPLNPGHPARVEIEYPERLSRLLIFVKWLLVIPHLVVLYVLSFVHLLGWIASWFAVLITGRYPPGLFDFMIGFHRWSLRTTGYVFLLTDRYPPFGIDDDPSYPIRVHVDLPPRTARWRPLVSWLLVIPAGLAFTLIALVAYLCVFLAWFAILFTGRYPPALFKVVAVTLRWTLRVNAYMYFMSNVYPPFVWA